ncbi:MAG TPA: hypothetical protein VN790_07610 [Steroidobacteraceae bacterium]|nr:hypothetical protein [Steroidobacteraceae bacterium]
MAKKPKASNSEGAAKAKPQPADAPTSEAIAAARSIARTTLRPTVNSARTIQTVRGDKRDDLSLVSLVDALSEQCALVSSGNLSRPEAVLTAQMHTLDALFSRLTRLACQNLDHFDAAERLFRLAFKAQSQARATVEALAVVKNPPVMFAKQANLTTGPQQINNNLSLARGIPEAAPNKLLEQTDGERLDSITTSGAVNSDPAMATVDVLHRAAHGRGQASGIPQCVSRRPPASLQSHDAAAARAAGRARQRAARAGVKHDRP